MRFNKLFTNEDYVIIGKNTVIEGFNFVTSGAVIKNNCKLNSFNLIKDSEIDNNCEITSSKIEKSKLHKNVSIGPNANLRPNSIICENAKVGNFVEVKNTTLGKNSKASHLAYLGDGEVGKDCNIGCGVIFCNYDGARKHKTKIGNNVFVGSNVNLVAPIKLGDNSLVGAGSTITDDVKKNSLAIARARQVEKLNYNKKKKDK